MNKAYSYVRFSTKSQISNDSLQMSGVNHADCPVAERCEILGQGQSDDMCHHDH